jgi:hypothetical protein
MTTPDNTKQARFSLEAHRALMDLAAELGGTADDALRHLLGLSTIRVAVTEVQRRRWIAQAQATGVPVDEFIRLRIEACLQFGADAATIQQMYNDVDALCVAMGVRRQPVYPLSTEAKSRRQLSTPNRPEA